MAMADPLVAADFEELLKAIYPNEDTRRVCVDFLAACAEKANAIGRGSWRVGTNKKREFLTLEVGFLVAVVLHPERVLVTLDEATDSESAAWEKLGTLSIAEGDVTRHPASKFWNLTPPSELADAIPVISAAFDRHLDMAANKKVGNPQHHASAAVDFLNAATGRSLPQPELSSSSPVEPKSGTSVTTSLGSVDDKFAAIRDHVRTHRLTIDDETLRRYHLSVNTRRGFVVLSGVSGTGKSWLARLYSDAVGGECLTVPIAPNWTTNEDLLGYQNPISGEYVDTEFSRFLREAIAEYQHAESIDEPPRLFFVVLDEMNLARVEYYFAKFLSAMEATEPKHRVIELSESETLPIPPNLRVIGTVNVDETTHGFADKVHDRAQVIELTIDEASLKKFVGKVDYGEQLLNVWSAVHAVAPFAFRVAEEIGQYLDRAVDDGLSWETALDHQVLQKVLPKLGRADDEVREVLEELISVCGDSMPLSKKKLHAMMAGYDKHGHVSFY